MKNHPLKLAALAVLCLLLPSCLPSKHPLSNAKQAKVDEQLIGKWTSGDGEPCYYYFGKRKGVPSGFVQIIGVEFDKDKNLSLIDAVGFSTTLGDDHYLNLAAGNGSQFDPSKKDPEEWQIFKYRIDGDRLDVWTADFDFVKQEIKAGNIQGEVDKPFVPTLTASTDNLAKWVAANSAKIFREKTTLKRAELN